MENTSQPHQYFDSIIQAMPAEVRPRLLAKESIKNMPKSLVAMTIVLHEAFKRFEVADDADVVLAVGNTGCGKSTMLTSLIDGPNSLQTKILKEEFETAL